MASAVGAFTSKKYALIFSFLLLIIQSCTGGDDEKICGDWGKRVEFVTCLEKEFTKKDFEQIKLYLLAEEFLLATKGQEDFWFFLKSSNSLSNYKIAILVWVSDDGLVQKIENR